MRYEVVYGQSFGPCVRQLEKRFSHVRDDVRVGIKAILQDSRIGVVIPKDYGARKLRLLSTDIKKGKRGGFRLIYLTEDLPEPRIYLLILYAKPDKGDVSRDELRRLVGEL